MNKQESILVEFVIPAVSVSGRGLGYIHPTLQIAYPLDTLLPQIPYPRKDMGQETPYPSLKSTWDQKYPAPPLWTEWLIDTSENITFSQLL